MKVAVAIALVCACGWLGIEAVPTQPHPLQLAGKCVGADPCLACSNCSRCKHCKAGGSCGACKAKKEKDGKGLMAYFGEPICR
jgi:hypothetical protein